MTSLFFFNDTATTEIYTLSLHDALPICLNSPLRREAALVGVRLGIEVGGRETRVDLAAEEHLPRSRARSEEHTSELQSPDHLVCRLLLEKKKIPNKHHTSPPTLRRTHHA